MVGEGEVKAHAEGVGEGPDVSVDELGVAANREPLRGKRVGVGEVQRVVGGVESGDAGVVLRAVWCAPVKGVLNAGHAETYEGSPQRAGGVKSVGVGEVLQVGHAGEGGGEGERRRVARGEAGERGGVAPLGTGVVGQSDCGAAKGLIGGIKAHGEKGIAEGGWLVGAQGLGRNK